MGPNPTGWTLIQLTLVASFPLLVFYRAFLVSHSVGLGPNRLEKWLLTLKPPEKRPAQRSDSRCPMPPPHGNVTWQPCLSAAFGQLLIQDGHCTCMLLLLARLHTVAIHPTCTFAHKQWIRWASIGPNAHILPRQMEPPVSQHATPVDHNSISVIPSGD